MSCLTQKKKKSPKFPKFFIIMFPKGEQVLVKSDNSWTGLIPYTNYVKDKFDENTVIIAIKWLEAIKFVLKGCAFNVDK